MITKETTPVHSRSFEIQLNERELRIIRTALCGWTRDRLNEEIKRFENILGLRPNVTSDELDSICRGLRDLLNGK